MAGAKAVIAGGTTLPMNWYELRALLRQLDGGGIPADFSRSRESRSVLSWENVPGWDDEALSP